jgi:NAD(P)-dependent dehydrogenase (short-subunit alcohol dehydrogenase family)
VEAVPLDQADLASIRAAAALVRATLATSSLGLSALVANAGIQTVDLHQRTRDGFELTFGVNVLGAHLLLRELAPVLVPAGRMVLVGSGTAEDRRKDGLVPVPRWEDPMVLAQPDRGEDADTLAAGRRAYSTSKLGTLYLAHAHARHAEQGHTVDVFDPGMMPGTGLARDASLVQRIGWQAMRPMARWASGMSTPDRSGLSLARMAMGEFGASGGRYVHVDHDVDPSPTAFDEEREERLWSVANTLTG